MSLKLEDYILKIVENKALFDDTNYPGYRVNFFPQDGFMEFVSTSGEVFRKIPIQIIGTISLLDNTWMWSWSNKSIPLKFTVAASKLKEQGEKENNNLFITPIVDLKNINLVADNTSSFGLIASILAAGNSNYYTWYTHRLPQSIVYVVFEMPAETKRKNLNLESFPKILMFALKRVGYFNHKKALINYLGESYSLNPEGFYEWDVPGGKFSVEFDQYDRVVGLLTEPPLSA